MVKQPFVSSAQVSSCPPAVQSRPAAVHSAGGAGHAPQLAAPAVPVQPCPQAVLPVITRHCAASSAQVTTLAAAASQYVPALPLHTAGAAGQVQAAFGKAPPHGSLDAQVVLPVWTTQPSASTAQVTSAPATQAAPAAVQPAGGAGQTQAAPGDEP